MNAKKISVPDSNADEHWAIDCFDPAADPVCEPIDPPDDMDDDPFADEEFFHYEWE